MKKMTIMLTFCSITLGESKTSFSILKNEYLVLVYWCETFVLDLLVRLKKKKKTMVCFILFITLQVYLLFFLVLIMFTNLILSTTSLGSLFDCIWPTYKNKSEQQIKIFPLGLFNFLGWLDAAFELCNRLSLLLHLFVFLIRLGASTPLGRPKRFCPGTKELSKHFTSCRLPLPPFHLSSVVGMCTYWRGPWWPCVIMEAHHPRSIMWRFCPWLLENRWVFLFVLTSHWGVKWVSCRKLLGCKMA